MLASAKDPVLRPGPISIYISRKLGKLFVRKGFEEVFEAPVDDRAAERAARHACVHRARSGDDGTMRWNVVSLPTDRVVKKGKYLMTMRARREAAQGAGPAGARGAPPGDPNVALDRITIPEETLARINELMSPGASLIISDLALSHETGKGTDFIVLTR